MTSAFKAECLIIFPYLNAFGRESKIEDLFGSGEEAAPGGNPSKEESNVQSEESV